MIARVFIEARMVLYFLVFMSGLQLTRRFLALDHLSPVRDSLQFINGSHHKWADLLARAVPILNTASISLIMHRTVTRYWG